MICNAWVYLLYTIIYHIIIGYQLNIDGFPIIVATLDCFDYLDWLVYPSLKAKACVSK